MRFWRMRLNFDDGNVGLTNVVRRLPAKKYPRIRHLVGCRPNRKGRGGRNRSQRSEKNDLCGQP